MILFPLQKWIREHKEDYRGNRTGDFQDLYMDKIKTGDDSSFTEDNLSAILREMFVMGAEAQSVLLRWAVRILSVHKEVQRRVQDEIEDVVGDDKDVLWSDRERCVKNSDSTCWTDSDSGVRIGSSLL